MNLWKQTKLYECRCGAKYLHDRAYIHRVFLCPGRFVEQHHLDIKEGTYGNR